MRSRGLNWMYKQVIRERKVMHACLGIRGRMSSQLLVIQRVLIG